MQFFRIGPGGTEKLPQPPEALPTQGFIWLQCTYEDGRDFCAEVTRLSGVSIYEDHVIDATNRQHPSYFDSTAQYDMLIFRGLASSAAQALAHNTFRLRTRPTVLFMLPRLLVTIHASTSQTVATISERLMRPTERGQRTPDRPEDLAIRLLNELIDRYLALRQPLTDLVERRQFELLDTRKPFRDWPLLLQARTELLKLQSLCEEQLDALHEWRDEHLERDGDESALHPALQGTPAQRAHFSEATRIRIENLNEHVQRVLAHVRRLETSAESAVQIHFSSTSMRTNDVMRTLTALTAIFLPLNLVTGIFGMNFEFIPGLHSKNGFWFSLLGMACIALALLVVFRWRRYIESADVKNWRLHRDRIERRSMRGTAAASGRTTTVDADDLDDVASDSGSDDVVRTG